ncbi:MAG: phosphate ABC transporter permease PstA [Maricaulaceae bacterium]
MLTRQFKSRLFNSAVVAALLIATCVMIGLIMTIFIKGAPAISLDFITAPAQNFGAGGGIAYQIIGSLIMVAVAACLVMPMAFGVSLYLSEFVTSAHMKKILLTALLTLNGVPSITFGIFGLIFFVYGLGTGISWFVGSIILAMMMLPTITLSTYQTINSIPTIYRENAYALGMSQSQTIWHVLLPQGFHGAVTGLLIALARAIGETAPIMFIATAFSGVSAPRGLNEPVSTLPTHILALAQQATNPQALQNGWGAALTLMCLVLFFSLTALIFRYKLQKGQTL